MIEVAAMCIGAGLLIGFTSRYTIRNAQLLDRATHVETLIGLKQFVEESPLDNTVVVYGTVGSTSSLEPKHTDSLSIAAVYVHETTIPMSSKIDSREEVPWYLDDGTAQVKVKDYRRAYGFHDMLAVYWSKAPVHKPFKQLASMKMKDVVIPAGADSCVIREQVLYVGTKMTIVGRAGIDEDGTPTIDEAYQFYKGRIEPKAKVSDLEQDSKFNDISAAVLTVIGIVILAETFVANIDSSSRYSITA